MSSWRVDMPYGLRRRQKDNACCLLDARRVDIASLRICYLVVSLHTVTWLVRCKHGLVNTIGVDFVAAKLCLFLPVPPWRLCRRKNQYRVCSHSYEIYQYQAARRASEVDALLEKSFDQESE